MKPEPNFYISHENFKQLIEGPGFWYKNDVPPERWAQVGKHFNNDDSFAVFASGSVVRPVESKGVQAVGGIDWIRLEANPKEGKPQLRVYHYVIYQPDDKGYPVYGPYRDGCLVPHWCYNIDDLIDKYS
ncbi:MAG: hypothetical protein WCE90_10160 [Candidatus Zixiibacteriota bacterium]